MPSQRRSGLSLWSFALVAFVSLFAVKDAEARSWTKLTEAPGSFWPRRGHSTLVVNKTILVHFGGRHTYFEDQRTVVGQVNVNLPPFQTNASYDWTDKDFVCPFGCYGNGLCTLPGVNPAALPPLLANQVNSYGLLTSTFQAGFWDPTLSMMATVLPDMVKAACGLSCSPCKSCGKCVCDDSYSGEFCHILEKDIFLNDITYQDLEKNTWWSRRGVVGSNDVKAETWPNLRANHAAVLLELGVPQSPATNTSNSTLVLWERDLEEAQREWVQAGNTLDLRTGEKTGNNPIFNGSFIVGPPRQMMVIYAGVSPTCGDYCYDVWIWDFASQVWYTDYAFSTGIQNEFYNYTAGPLNRWQASAIAYNNRMILYAGHRMHTFLADMWELDVQTFKWTQIFPANGSAVPSPRTGQAATRYLDGFFMFGGYTDLNAVPPVPNFLNDIWYFNFTTRVWKDLTPKSTAVMPITRAQSSMIMIDSFVFMFGGYTNNQYFGDVWRFNVSSGFWTMQVIFRGQNDNILPRSQHTMMHFPHLDGFAIFGGYGSNSSGIVTNFETDYNDMWLFNVTDCPNACNGRGKCSLGFCYCDEGFYGPDCQEVSCPDDYCVYDIVTQVQTCVHCYGQGSCVNGMCRCFDNYDGESCAVLLCPNNCNLHGVCINVEGTPACLCNPPYGGVDCLLPQCMNQCTGRGNCTIDGAQGKCVCKGGFLGADCSLVDYQYGE